MMPSYTTDDNGLTYSTRTLEKLQIGLEQIVSHELMDGRVDMSTDNILLGVRMRLRGYIWSEQVEVIKYPADWWQALKARWFPKWALRRWPVDYIVYDVRVIYPDYRVAVPGNEWRWHVARQY